MRILPILFAIAVCTSNLAFSQDQKDEPSVKEPSGQKADEAEAKADKTMTKEEPGVAKAISGAAKIDGKIDDAWKKAPMLKVVKPVDGIVQIEEKDMATATVQVMYDQDTLYALWQVTDDKLSDGGADPWEHDSVELFLDQDNKKSSVYDDNDGQYRVNFKGLMSGQGTGYNKDFCKAATAKTENGYIVEMALKITHVKLKSGVKMGFDLQVNDDAGDGSRSAVAKWYNDEDDSWENASTFGTLILK